jgi:hypothetical protein
MVGELQLIDIVGLNEGQEYEAALHLRWLLLKLWPDLAQSRKDSIKMIFVGLKLCPAVSAVMPAARRSFNSEVNRIAQGHVPPCHSMRSSLLTRRRREMDSNYQFRSAPQRPLVR